MSVRAYQFIAEAVCGDAEDWMDAITAIGVRPAYYDGMHRAYLGKYKPCWTNATVARFDSATDATAWCERVNALCEIEDQQA